MKVVESFFKKLFWADNPTNFPGAGGSRDRLLGDGFYTDLMGGDACIIHHYIVFT